MSSAIPNNLPLQNLTSTYSSNNLTASLQFNSCLTGYPFTSTDTNWRTASMERRSAPTPINYSSSANGDLLYDSGAMKGIQIKQPFKDGSLENILRIVFPTTGLQQIKISFAVETDGAANSLIFDYWNGTNWVNTGISNPTTTIGVGYSLVEVNLNQVLLANNSAEFQFRIRFDGNNMFLSEGKRVQFNNIAIAAQQILAVQNVVDDLKFTAFPNPASSVVNVKSGETITHLELHNLYGQMVRTLSPNASVFKVEIQDLPQGIYLLKAKSNRQKEKIIKIIKN
ncbi:MAG: T9SS type A sorting domain-containing protein, partial [Flavobacterium sp.]|nr:T9SS type A sorting domain-containing protein [Flavobacterium sp.]